LLGTSASVWVAFVVSVFVLIWLCLGVGWRVVAFCVPFGFGWVLRCGCIARVGALFCGDALGL